MKINTVKRTFGQPVDNPDNLRVIKTARTEEAINAAAREGIRPLVKAVEPSPEVQSMVVVHQHRETGEIHVSGDTRWGPGDEYECVIPFHCYYPYTFPAPFAAYLIPADLQEGERVWLEDLIEDRVAVYGNQGWCPRLEAGEAIWTQGDFAILFNSETDADRLIG